MNDFYFKEFKYFTCELLTKNQVLEQFEITHECFDKSAENGKLLFVDDHQTRYPAFQFKQKLIERKFGDLVKSLYETMNPEGIIEYLFSKIKSLKNATGFEKPIDAFMNGFTEEVFTLGTELDLVKMVENHENPEEELYRIFKEIVNSRCL